MSKKYKIVVPNLIGGWEVRGGGSRHVDTQAGAIGRARQIVRNSGAGGEFVVSKQGTGRSIVSKDGTGRSIVHKNGGAPSIHNKRTYDVTVEREGRWWVFEIPELDTAGQARNLAEVSDEARGIISAWEHVDIDSVDVSVTVKATEDARTEWQKAEAELAAAQAHANEVKRAVVVRLRSKGLTADDTGRVLGISKQRVFQIEKETTRVK
ncbi:DUF2188 domain-containing protein [Curtobacterium sp. MCLR17_054]|uniref:DUF2188 domain-containing protein n=1 Tax=Curtobacterium sp. MCLR17_054 TaxID=2175632 RepID=UPI001C64D106|nr:DUF2188 domain-containing protein [Curtobacterium sp. MCLR17_054]WIE70353.1 DUF2188 domain-containing protein [Curtobacterium sp. MCLR17_054]